MSRCFLMACLALLCVSGLCAEEPWFARLVPPDCNSLQGGEMGLFRKVGWLSREKGEEFIQCNRGELNLARGQFQAHDLGAKAKPWNGVLVAEFGPLYWKALVGGHMVWGYEHQVQAAIARWQHPDKPRAPVEVVQRIERLRKAGTGWVWEGLKAEVTMEAEGTMRVSSDSVTVQAVVANAMFDDVTKHVFGPGGAVCIDVGPYARHPATPVPGGVQIGATFTREQFERLNAACIMRFVFPGHSEPQ